ncbi:single-stranded DNA-binding protein, partial [Microvirga sp. 2YAF29]
IVLQRFRGDLTILDARSGGGGGSSEYGEEEGGGQISRGGDFGRSSPMERRPEPVGEGSRRSNFDDDIPF